MVKIGTVFKKNATKVLFLGSGELGREVVIELKRLGAEVIAVDRYADAPAMQVADRSYVISMLDPDKLEEIVLKENPSLIVPEVEAIATQKLVELEKGELKVYPCGYADYTAAKQEAAGRAEAAAKAEKAEERAAKKESSYRSKAERAEEAKRKQLLRQTEADIAAAEQAIAETEAEIARPDIAADYRRMNEACEKLNELHARLDSLYAQYEKLI